MRAQFNMWNIEKGEVKLTYLIAGSEKWSTMSMGTEWLPPLFTSWFWWGTSVPHHAYNCMSLKDSLHVPKHLKGHCREPSDTECTWKTVTAKGQKKLQRFKVKEWSDWPYRHLHCRHLIHQQQQWLSLCLKYPWVLENPFKCTLNLMSITIY